MTFYLNLVIQQGASFSKNAIAKQIVNGVKILRPLTNLSGRGQVRKAYNSPDILAEFEVTIDQVASKIIWTLPATTTALIPANCSSQHIPEGFATMQQVPDCFREVAYVWDLELFLDAWVDRYIEGLCLVTPEVTR